jgi:hypothetical protein
VEVKEKHRFLVSSNNIDYEVIYPQTSKKDKKIVEKKHIIL